MKSLAKALLLIACLLCCCWMVITDHPEVGICILLIGVLIALFYEAEWK